jgi:hypothetical protein
LARREARGVQVHQGQQGEGRRRGRGGVRRQQRAQAADSVFTKRGAGVTFVPLGAPPPEAALAHLVGRATEHFERWVRRHGKGGDADADASNETRTPSAIETRRQAASQRGPFARLDEPPLGELGGDDMPLAPRPLHLVATQPLAPLELAADLGPAHFFGIG